MIAAFRHKNLPITFRQWSRKNYAIFSSLGKEINIGHVDVDICDKAINKSSNLDIFSNNKTEAFRDKEDVEETMQTEGVVNQTSSLLFVTSNLDDSSRQCRRLSIRNISDYITGSRFRELELLYNKIKYGKSIKIKFKENNANI